MGKKLVTRALALALVAGCATTTSTTDTLRVSVDTAALRGGVVAVAPAQYRTCVLDDAGAVWCWRHTEAGVSGAADLGHEPATPVRAALPGSVAQLIAGHRTACALLAAGELYCWGTDVPVGLAAGSAEIPPTAPVRLDLPPVLDARLSSNGGVALLTDGSVRMWTRRGYIEPRQPIPPILMLGDGDPFVIAFSRDRQLVRFGDHGRQITTSPYEGPPPRRVAATRYSTWILSDDGGLYQIERGRGDAAPVRAPLEGVADLAVGGGLCARTSEGEVFCVRDGWVRVPWTGVRSISSGPLRICGVGVEGALCWVTAAEDHQPDTLSRLEWRASGPVAFVPHVEAAITAGPVCGTGPDGLRVLEVATGYGHSCALLDDGTVRCWGLSNAGEAGDRAAVEQRTPVAVRFDRPVSHIWAGSSGTCALDERGGVLCLGRAASGGYDSIPVQVRLRGRATQVALGNDHVCALTSEGRVHCWGRNQHGQLGDGTTRDRRAPVRVRLQQRAEHIAAGDATTCAAAGGAAYCWGTAQRLRAPLQVTGIPGRVTRVAVADQTVCALLDDGRVLCWGDGSAGQLGPRGGAGSADPVLVEVPAAVDIAGAGTQFCTRTAAGSVDCWGASAAREAAPAAVRRVEWIEPARQLAVGHRAVCTAAEGGGACCWGARLSVARGERGSPGPLPPGPVVW